MESFTDKQIHDLWVWGNEAEELMQQLSQPGPANSTAPYDQFAEDDDGA